MIFNQGSKKFEKLKYKSKWINYLRKYFYLLNILSLKLYNKIINFPCILASLLDS